MPAAIIPYRTHIYALAYKLMAVAAASSQIKHSLDWHFKMLSMHTLPRCHAAIETHSIRIELEIENGRKYDNGKNVSLPFKVTLSDRHNGGINENRILFYVFWS